MNILHVILKKMCLILFWVDDLSKNRVIVAVTTEEDHIFRWRNIEDIH